ncbi:MAG: hypothetical protein SGPRY_014978 [Prymnesium sp.]
MAMPSSIPANTVHAASESLRRPLLHTPPGVMRRQSSLKRMVAAFQKANQAVLSGADARRLSFDNLGSRLPSRTLGTLGSGLTRWNVALAISSNLSGGGLGGASLALPYAVAAVGWSGLALIAMMTVITSWTGKLLVRSVNTLNERKRSRPALLIATTGKCTGHRSRLASRAMQTYIWAMASSRQVLTLFECYGCLVCLLVLQRTNWPAILGISDAWGLLFVIITSVCAFFILFIDVQFLSQLASSGIVAAAALICFQCALDWDLAWPDGFLCPRTTIGATPSAELLRHSILEPNGIGDAIGLVIFCFAGHATFPTLQNQSEPS